MRENIYLLEDFKKIQVKNVPLEFPPQQIQEISAAILYASPEGGKGLNNLWRQDPKQFAWQIVDAFKLISVIHDFSGWNR